MSIALKKEILLQRIEETNNEELLDEVAQLLNKDDWWNHISEEEKASILRGVDDYKNGRFKTHKEVMDNARKWIAEWR